MCTMDNDNENCLSDLLQFGDYGNNITWEFF